MAKFLVTSGVTYKLEELIKETEDRLILISPYLQFSKRIKDNIENLNILKRDIRIIYRKTNYKLKKVIGSKAKLELGRVFVVHYRQNAI